MTRYVALSSIPVGARLATRTTPGSTGAFVEELVEVADRNVAGLRLAVRHLGSVSGRIQMTADARGNGPASVRLQPVLLTWRASEHRALVGTAGDFVFDDVEPGEYALRVDGAYGIKAIVADGVDYTDRSVAVTADVAITNVRVSVGSMSNNVTGALKDPAATGARRLALVVVPLDERLWTAVSVVQGQIRVVAFDRTGRFVIPNLPPGSYVAVATELGDLGDWNTLEFLRRAASVGTRFDLQWNENRDVQVAYRARVR